MEETNKHSCFTPWFSWAKRREVPDKGKPGVYLIGRFEQSPPHGPADPKDARIVYIGESSGGRLLSRWRSFDRTAFQNKGKHRGDMRYKKLIGGDSSFVYVSTHSQEGLVRAFLGMEKCP